MNLTNRDFDLVNSYIVLAHSEVESYVEEVALEVIAKSKGKWVKEGRTCHPIAALMLYSERQYQIPESFGGNSSDKLFDTVAIKVLQNHENFIRGHNHGIKKKNLLKMFLPLGVMQNEFDDSWLDSMDNLGRERGSVAHSSVRSLKKQLHPNAARNCVQEVLPGLDQLGQMALLLHKR